MRCYLLELNEQERKESRRENISLENGGIDESFTFAHRVTNKALDYIDKHKEEDLFLCVSYDEPHQPYLCPEPFASMYETMNFQKLQTFMII